MAAISGRVRFGKPQSVLFFDDAKKQLLTIKPDGLEEYQGFESFDTKQMVALEAPHIREALVAKSRLELNEASLADMLGVTAVGWQAMVRGKTASRVIGYDRQSGAIASG